MLCIVLEKKILVFMIRGRLTKAVLRYFKSYRARCYDVTRVRVKEKVMSVKEILAYMQRNALAFATSRGVPGSL